MWLTILVLFFGFGDTQACRPRDYYADRPGRPSRPLPSRSLNKSYFANDSTWGGWSPPKGNDSWMDWIEKWGSPNNSNVDNSEEGRGPESGWPSYWKKLGLANRGVPPPPWALVPSSYGKPQFCFLQPYKGNCNDIITRWGYNPTKNQCQIFTYSGCGGNQNNFNFKQDCVKA